MNLNALTPEQWAALIIALGTSGAAVIAAFGYLIRSYGKVQVLKAQTNDTVAKTRADIERMETETDRDVTKTITGELVVERSENRDLHLRLRECEVSGKEKDGIIKELRTMNVALGEKNGIQAKLLMDAAKEIEALRGIEEFQRQKITRYELTMADKQQKENGIDPHE
jgi:hypothetical protein